MDSAKRVALNTSFLYSKMLITIVISLYSTRLILDALGEQDFGIFSVVAGAIGMLSFLNGAMAVSTQRYLSYYLGAKQIAKQKQVFNSSVILHLIIGTIVVILLEILGYFLFNFVLNIPEERISAAKVVYHCMVVSTFFTINAVPYDASINANENMLLDSIVGIIESILKLGIAIWLLHTATDKLVLYGFLFAFLTITIRFIKSIYCSKFYDECKLALRKYYKPELLREMFSFSGWNLFGAASNVARNQGLQIILNNFHSVAANTAYGIANQVSGQLSVFSLNMMRAINPQIVKSEGGGDRQRMIKLADLACKLSFFLLAIFAIPLIAEMELVLTFWLKKVPEYAIIFCQLVLVSSLVRQITYGLMTAVQSVGKIKLYQSIVSTTLILNIPVSIILMLKGFPAHYIFYGTMSLEFLAALGRVYFANKLAGLNATKFLLKTMLASFFTVSLAYLLALIPKYFMDVTFIRLLLSAGISFFTIISVSILLSFTKEEKSKITELIRSVIKGLVGKLKLS